MTFMRARSPGTLPTLSQSWFYFKSMSDELLRTYAAAQGKGVLFSCTVAETEVFYCPPGWLVADRGSGPFNVGLKMSILSKAHADVLSALYREMQSKNVHTKGSGPALKHAVA